MISWYPDDMSMIMISSWYVTDHDIVFAMIHDKNAYNDHDITILHDINHINFHKYREFFSRDIMILVTGLQQNMLGILRKIPSHSWTIKIWLHCTFYESYCQPFGLTKMATKLKEMFFCICILVFCLIWKQLMFLFQETSNWNRKGSRVFMIHRYKFPVSTRIRGIIQICKKQT